jgi:uncharacterized protein (TIGR03435 family)
MTAGRKVEMQRISRFKITGSLLLLLLTTSVGLAAQSGTPDSTSAPTFEVATIKANTSGSGGSSSGMEKGRFIATNVTIRGLLRFEAFLVANARIVGGPKWMDSARFDIDAKLDPEDAKRLDALPFNQRNAVKQAVVQKLLADRFQLKTHWEDREQSVYEIVVAKGGAKLQPVADVKRGFGWSLGGGKLSATDATLGQVADLFTQGAADELGRVVLDRTGIVGAFDINLKWAPNTGAAAATDAPTGPSLFTAIQEQLGLKLEPTKAPVKVLVVDQLEMPSEN